MTNKGKLETLLLAAAVGYLGLTILRVWRILRQPGYGLGLNIDESECF